MNTLELTFDLCDELAGMTLKDAGLFLQSLCVHYPMSQSSVIVFDGLCLSVDVVRPETMTETMKREQVEEDQRQVVLKELKRQVSEIQNQISKYEAESESSKVRQMSNFIKSFRDINFDGSKVYMSGLKESV